MTTSFVQAHGWNRIHDQGAATEIRTGKDPNGDAPDIEIVLHPIDAVPAPVERTEFPPGLATIGISDIPRYDEMVDHVLDQLDWDRSRFRGFRLRCQYPLPFVTYGQLFELPPVGSKN